MKFQYISSDVPLPSILESRHMPSLPPPLMDHMNMIPNNHTPYSIGGPNCTTSSLTLLQRPHLLSTDPTSSHLGVQSGFIHHSPYSNGGGAEMQLHSVNHYAPHHAAVPPSPSLSHHPLHSLGAYNGPSIFNSLQASKMTPPILTHTPILTAE